MVRPTAFLLKGRMPAEITSAANGATGTSGAAVALEGCRIWRSFSGARVEIVSAAVKTLTPRAPSLRDDGAGMRGVMRRVIFF
jgi:hypothetical protein